MSIGHEPGKHSGIGPTFDWRGTCLVCELVRSTQREAVERVKWLRDHYHSLTHAYDEVFNAAIAAILGGEDGTMGTARPQVAEAEVGDAR